MKNVLRMWTLGLVSSALASYGDQGCPVYRGCIRRCLEDCPNFTVPDWRPRHKDITPLYSAPWSPLPCPLQCRAECTKKSAESRKLKKQNTTKYYGKWPFRRIFGCDEFFSFIFSIGNSLGVMLGIKRCTVQRSSFYSTMVKMHALISAIVWLLSGECFFPHMLSN